MISEHNPHVITEPYGFVWRVSPGGYEWRDGLLRMSDSVSGRFLVPQKPDTQTEWERTRPLRKPRLYECFARLTIGEKAIQGFANRYGLIDTVTVLDGTKRELVEARYSGSELRFWEYHVHLMRELIALRDTCATVRRNTTRSRVRDDALRSYVTWDYEWLNGGRVKVQLPGSETFGFFSRWYDADTAPDFPQWTGEQRLHGPAFKFLCETINGQLRGVVSPLVIPHAHGAPLFAPHTLIAALYLQLALSLPNQPKHPRYCQMCRMPLDPHSRSDRRTCGAKCRKEWQRMKQHGN